MPHGHPDYGQSQSTKIVSTVADLGELAARLGSPDTYHRGGNIVWYDKLNLDYRHLDYDVSDAGADIFIDGENYHRWGGALALVAGDADGDETRARKDLPPLTPVICGMEITFLPIDTPHELQIDFCLSDGSRYLYSGAFLDFDNEEISIVNPAGGYTKVDDLMAGVISTTQWSTLKLVINFENDEYKNLFLNEQSVDIEGNSIGELFPSPLYFLRSDIIVIGDGSNNPQVNVNDWIVTINEP
jgi:hypothetical protein